MQSPAARSQDGGYPWASVHRSGSTRASWEVLCVPGSQGWKRFLLTLEICVLLCAFNPSTKMLKTQSPACKDSPF